MKSAWPSWTYTIVIGSICFFTGMNFGLFVENGIRLPQESKSINDVQSNRDYYSINRINEGVSAATNTEIPLSQTTFIFFMGLEGTGHHLVSQIVRDSPMKQNLEKLHIFPAETANLSKSLYFEPSRRDGLFSGMCLKGDHKSMPLVNTTALQEKVATQLRIIASKASSSEKPLVVPVNSWGLHTVGEMSYPNFRGMFCRNLMYPNIDLLYGACDVAGVLCSHVYLYRDPFAVIHSTSVKRSFQPSKLDAIHNYKSLLDIIFAQMSSHRFRTMGCINLFSDESAEIAATFNFLRDTLGWDTEASFQAYLSTVYKPPEDLEEARKSVPNELNAAMKSFTSAHARNVKLCQTLANDHKSVFG